MDITTRLRSHRQTLKLSLRAVESATGISRNTLSKIETGGQVPSRDDARNLYQFYKGKVPIQCIYDPLFEFEVKHDSRRTR